MYINHNMLPKKNAYPNNKLTNCAIYIMYRIHSSTN